MQGGRPRRWRIQLVAAIAIYAAAVSSVWAQAGRYVTPSVALSESWDDNLFSTPTNRLRQVPLPPTFNPDGTPAPPQFEMVPEEKTSDYVFRASPGVLAGYRSNGACQ